MIRISTFHIRNSFLNSPLDKSNHGIAISRLIKYLGLKQMPDYQER